MTNVEIKIALIEAMGGYDEGNKIKELYDWIKQTLSEEDQLLRLQAYRLGGSFYLEVYKFLIAD